MALALSACTSQPSNSVSGNSGTSSPTLSDSSDKSSVSAQTSNSKPDTSTSSAEGNSSSEEASGSGESKENDQTSNSEPKEETSNTNSSPEESSGSKVLVAYFSCTGNTKGLAEKIAAALNADIYEIVPEQPYTDADLNYNNSSSRSTKEQNDNSCRPVISGSANNMGSYDTVVLGYPIWWGQAPKILYTFVESYDLSGKTVVPFCTSASSGVGSSASNLHSSAPGANWLDGTRLSSSASNSDIEKWLGGLGLI